MEVQAIENFIKVCVQASNEGSGTDIFPDTCDGDGDVVLLFPMDKTLL